MSQEHEKFFVAQWGVLIRNNHCLIVRGTNEKEWQLPGGRIDQDELHKDTMEGALQREIFEELNLEKIKIIELIDALVGYTSGGKAVCRLIYLIQNKNDEIKLSNEQEEMRWITSDEIDNFVYKELTGSKSLKEILKKAFSIYNQN